MAGAGEPPITAASSRGAAGLGPGIRGHKEAQKTAEPRSEFVWILRLRTPLPPPTHVPLFFLNSKNKNHVSSEFGRIKVLIPSVENPSREVSSFLCPLSQMCLHIFLTPQDQSQR